MRPVAGAAMLRLKIFFFFSFLLGCCSAQNNLGDPCTNECQPGFLYLKRLKKLFCINLDERQMSRKSLGLVWWEKTWPSWSGCPLCPRHQVRPLPHILLTALLDIIIFARVNAHLLYVVFQARARVCWQLQCKGKWKSFPASLNISSSEWDLLLVLDQRSERGRRLLGEVRDEQGRPELHG